MNTTIKTASDFARAIADSTRTLNADLDVAAFDARQRALWGAVAKRSRRFHVAVLDALRELP